MKFWTTKEIAFLRAHYAGRGNTELAEVMGRSVPSVQHKAMELGLKKTPETVRKLSKFTPGHETWNKGKPHRPAGSERAYWKPGQLPHNVLPIGAVRVNNYGIRVQKVAETRDRKTDWRPVKDLLWEKHHGPIPAGHIVVVENRDPGDLRPDNLLCLTKAENMRRNSIHRLGRERASAIQKENWRKRKALPFAQYIRAALG